MSPDLETFNKPEVLKRKVRLAKLAMAILCFCYFIWFMCSLESVGWIKFELFGNFTWWIFQALIVISLIAINISYKLHRSLLPLIIGFVSTAIIFHAYHFEHDENWQTEMAIGMVGFTIATVINMYKLNNKSRHEQKS